MKRFKSSEIIFILVALIAISQSIEAQNSDKTVTITASGNGKTQDEAQQSALRSAIEQTFGVFISSKTEVFNDQLIADDIASVASGNIQSFEILNASQFPDKNWGITLRAIVSITKLTNYVQSKGVSVEIQGGLFAVNIRQLLLNEKGEEKAIDNLINLLNEQMQLSYDYSIIAGEPFASGNNWAIPVKVTAITNKNIDFCSKYCKQTLAALSLKCSEVKYLKSIEKNVSPIIVNGEIYYLRNQSSMDKLFEFREKFYFYSSLYAVKVGKDEFIAPKMNDPEFYCNEKCQTVFNHKDIVGCYELSDTHNRTWDSKGLLLDFPDSGNLVSTFSWSWSYTLENIEKIKGFFVNPLGVILQYKQGGIVVNDTNGQILVVASQQKNGNANWDDAKKWCKELNYNGFNDWRLPTKEELNLLFVKFWGFTNIPNLPFLNSPNYNSSSWYWSSDECPDTETAIECMQGYNKFNCTKKSEKNKVIAVRTYNINPKVQNEYNPNNSPKQSNSINNEQSNTVTDIDGNVYKTITIGSQTWMAENQKVTHYQNGDPIPNIIDNEAWGSLTTGAYCDYDNQVSNGLIYGHLYNWYTVQDIRRIAPKGWHIPTDYDWTTLQNYFKVNGLNLESNNDTNKSSIFNVLLSGDRNNVNGKFLRLAYNISWWSAIEHNINNADIWCLGKHSVCIFNSIENKKFGFSVRCVKD